jgi:hypothetical protein
MSRSPIGDVHHERLLIKVRIEIPWDDLFTTTVYISALCENSEYGETVDYPLTLQKSKPLISDGSSVRKPLKWLSLLSTAADPQPKGWGE